MEEKIKNFCKIDKLRTNNFYNIDTIIAIGDIHGDYKQIIDILKRLNIIELVDNDYKLVRHKNTVVIQVGDQLDGKRHIRDEHKDLNYNDEDIKVISLFAYLREESEKYPEDNYHIISIIGNHEYMNLYNDYRYVTTNEYQIKGKIVTRERIIKALEKEIVCKRYYCVSINGKFLFTHSGIVENRVRELDEKYKDIGIVQRLEQEQDNDKKIEILDEIIRYLLIRNINDKRLDKELFNMIGSREYKEESTRCDILNKLNIIKIENMIVGHMPQDNIKETKCSNKGMYLIDTALSRGFGTNRSSYYKHIPIVLRIDNANNDYKVKQMK